MCELVNVGGGFIYFIFMAEIHILQRKVLVTPLKSDQILTFWASLGDNIFFPNGGGFNAKFIKISSL